MRKAIFGPTNLLHRNEFFHIITNSVTIMTLFAHGGISKKMFMGYADIINEALSQNF